MSLFSVGDKHAGEYHDAAQKGKNGDGFVENKGTGQNSGNGIEVDVVGGFYSSNLFYGKAPKNETNEGGDDAEVDNVEIDYGLAEQCP